MITTGGEGKVPPRKRLRGKIGNPSNAPELKTHNLINNTNDTSQTFYNNFIVKGVFSSIGIVNRTVGLWWPIKCEWPIVGDSAHERIGRKIRVKLLRLKGYVAYSPYLITQVRYRIVLYRTRKAAVYNFHDFILPMYSHAVDLGEAPSMATLQSGATVCYYESFFNKDYMKVHDLKRRVLYRGLIKPQPDVPDFSLAARTSDGSFASGQGETTIITSTAGKNIGTISGVLGNAELAAVYNGTNLQTAPTTMQGQNMTQIHNIPFRIAAPAANYVGSFVPHFLPGAGQSALVTGNMRGFFPIDLTVAMNDNVDCDKYDYVFVFESDWAIGQDPYGTFSNTDAGTNFFLSFIPHIYYTDD